MAITLNGIDCPCPHDGIQDELHSGAKALIVGIAPGFNEMIDGRPFVGQTGQLLDSVTRACGFAREDFSYANLCCWRPPDDNPTVEDMIACAPRLQCLITTLHPRLIIPLGALAAEAFTGGGPGMSGHPRARGKNGKFSITKLRGQPLYYTGVYGTDHDCRIMATWHPAAFLRESGQNYILDICRDFKKLMPPPKGQDILNWTPDHGAFNWVMITDSQRAITSLKTLIPGVPVAIDIETGNPENVDEMTMDVFREKLLCFSIAQVNPQTGNDVTFAQVFTPPAFPGFVDWFKEHGAEFEWITHYGFFDKQGLHRLLGIDLKIGRDTLDGSYALDERQGVHQLKTNGREYTGADFWEAPIHDAIAEWQRKARLLALADSPSLFVDISSDVLCDPTITLEKNSQKGKNDAFLVGTLTELYPDLPWNGPFHRSRRTMDDDHLAWYNARLEQIKETGWDIVPLPILAKYNAEDSARTAQLDIIQHGMMADDGVLELYNDLMVPDMNVNAEIALRGMHIDQDKHAQLVLKWGPLWQQLQKELIEEATSRGFENEDGSSINLASPRQKARFIYDILQIVPPISKKLYTSTGQQSTNIKLLTQVKDQDEWLQKYIAFTHLDHSLGSYVLPILNWLRDDGRVHATWKPHAARTGRDAFSNPPWHQLPKHVEDDEEFKRFIGSTGHEIREMVTVDDDDYVLVWADYERGEFYVAAYVSGDDNLLEDCKAEDLHRAVAAKRLFHIPESEVSDKQRRDAKYVNFGMMFGMEADSMAKEHLHCPVWEAQKFIDAWWAGYPQLRTWTQERKIEAMTTGEIVSQINGRKRRFVLILGEGSFHELNQAVNMPIQGGLGDYQKDSRIKLHYELQQYSSYVINHCHDEITFEIHRAHFSAAFKVIHEIMTEPKFGLPGIPIDAKAGPSWGNGQKIKRDESGIWRIAA